MVRSLANYPDVGHSISGLEHGVKKGHTIRALQYYYSILIFWKITILPSESNLK